MPAEYKRYYQIAEVAAGLDWRDEVAAGLDWRDGAVHILNRTTDLAADKMGESLSKELLERSGLQNKLPELVVDVGSQAAGAVASVVSAGLIKSVWKRHDMVSRQLDRLLRGPFIAGTRMANEALALPYTTEEERTFREQRFDAAINELDRAWGLLKNPAEISSDRFTITLLQGQCAYLCRGGRQLACRRLGECRHITTLILDFLAGDSDSHPVNKGSRSAAWYWIHTLLHIGRVLGREGIKGIKEWDEKFDKILGLNSDLLCQMIQIGCPDACFQ